MLSSFKGDAHSHYGSYEYVGLMNMRIVWPRDCLHPPTSYETQKGQAMEWGRGTAVPLNSVTPTESSLIYRIFHTY